MLQLIAHPSNYSARMLSIMDSDPLNYASREWFITGCSSGLGAALARAALDAGDFVTATARDAGALAEFADHPRCLTLALDVTCPEQIRSGLAAAVKARGRLDVIVNNAGAGLLGALEDCDDNEISRCMAVNFHGPLGIMRAAAPVLRAQGGGHVINISAAAAIANYPGFAIYGAAKAALEAASESYRAELAPHGVKVTVVQPGPFRTQFIGRSLQRSAQQSAAHDGTVGKFSALLEKMDGRQPGDPDKAAQAIVRMVQEGRAPMRLVLGNYAQKKVRDTVTLRLRELETTGLLTAGMEFRAS